MPEIALNSSQCFLSQFGAYFFFSDHDCSVMEYRSTEKWSMVKCALFSLFFCAGIEALGEQTMHES